MAGPDRIGYVMSYMTSLKIRCRCGHKRTLYRDEAIKLFGERATPVSIYNTAKCSECGAKGPEVWI